MPYDILDGLGVRWFWPGEIGESVPEHSTIYIPDLDRTFEPGFARRHIWAPDTRLPKDLRAQYNDWQRRNRMPGPLTGSMGHAYNRIVKTSDPELFAQHPEYFAQVGGKRVMNSDLHNQPRRHPARDRLCQGLLRPEPRRPDGLDVAKRWRRVLRV